MNTSQRQNRARPQSSVDARVHRQGDTKAMHASDTRHPDEPQLPHERDESSSHQASAHEGQRRVARQAHADIASGKVDTDRGPVMDRVYNDKVKK